MPLARLLSVAVLLALVSACAPEQAPPPRPHAELLRFNPDLVAFKHRDPTGFEDIARAIQHLRKLPEDPTVTLPRKHRQLEDPTPEARKHEAIVRAVRRNPVIREIYKKDPKATAKLISIILTK